MKKKQTRSSGGGRLKPSGFGPGGMNSDGPNYMNIGYDRPHTFGKSPDSLYSRMSQQQFPKDYLEDPNMLEEDEETLEEFFARMIKMPLTEEEKKDIIDEDPEQEKEEEVDEMISGGVPGAAVTIGLGPDAKKRKKDWRSKFDKFSRKMFGGGS